MFVILNWCDFKGVFEKKEIVFVVYFKYNKNMLIENVRIIK